MSDSGTDFYLFRWENENLGYAMEYDGNIEEIEEYWDDPNVFITNRVLLGPPTLSGSKCYGVGLVWNFMENCGDECSWEKNTYELTTEMIELIILEVSKNNCSSIYAPFYGSSYKPEPDYETQGQMLDTLSLAWDWSRQGLAVFVSYHFLPINKIDS